MGEISEVVRIVIEVDGADSGARDVNLTQSSIDRLTSSLSNFRKQAGQEAGALKRTFEEISKTVKTQLNEPLESANLSLKEIRQSQTALNTAFKQSGIPAQRKEIALLRREVDQLEKELLEAADAQDLFGKGLKATSGVTNASNFAFIQLGRGIEDLRFGAVNAVNNIEPVITAITILRNEAAAAGTTVTQSLVRSLTSPAGLLFAGQSLLTLAVVLGPRLNDLFAGGAESAIDMRKEIEALIDSIIEVEETELKFNIDPTRLQETLNEINSTIDRVREDLRSLTSLDPTSAQGGAFTLGATPGAGSFTTRVLTDIEQQQKRASEDRLEILQEISRELEKQVVIQEARQRVEAELARVGDLTDPEAEDKARRAAEELARNQERLAKELGTVRIGLIEDETDRAIVSARREFAERIKLAEQVNDAEAVLELQRAQRTTISRLRAQARKEELEAEEGFYEQLRTLDEEFRILRGESEEVILNERLDRVDRELEAAELTIERERELLIERDTIINDLIQLEIKRADEIEKQQTRINRLRDRENAQAIQFNNQLASAERNLRITLGEDRLEILRQSQAEVQDQIQLRREAAAEEEAILSGQIDKEDELLRARIANARIEQQLQLESLNIQQQIAREEQRILESRAQQLQQFTDIFANSILDFRRQSDSLTDFDIRAQRREFAQREEALRESLRRNLIDQEQYSFDVQQLQQDRSQFERQVEEERAGFLRTLREGLTDFLIEEGLRQLSAFIARTTAQALFAKGAQATATAATVASMGAIGTAAAPAAAATSIATFGASAAAGTAAANTGILQVTALVKSLQAAAGVGFKEGGYTGDASKHQIAGVVHGGEYVMPANIVQGQVGAFRRLHNMLETRALNLDQLIFMLGARGFQSGGFVPTGVATPAFAPASNASRPGVESGRGIDSLRSDVGRLANAVTRLANRPNEVVISPRSSRQITKAASMRTREVRPRRFRK
jgi:hypothetical protein